jgi:hypothetical protein
MPRLHHFWAGLCLPADDFTVTIHTIYSSTLTIIHPSTCRRNSKRGPWLAREVKCTKTRWIRPKLLLLKMVDPWPLKLNPLSWTGRKEYFLAQKCLCEVRGLLTMLYWLAGGSSWPVLSQSSLSLSSSSDTVVWTKGSKSCQCTVNCSSTNHNGKICNLLQQTWMTSSWVKRDIGTRADVIWDSASGFNLLNNHAKDENPPVDM